MERLDLLFDTSSAYSVVVQLPTLLVCTCTVTAVAGGAVNLSGYDGTSAVTRLVFGTTDVGILSMSPAGSVWSFSLEDTTGITVGMSVDLWMTDPLESAPVSALDQLVNPTTGHLCSRITLGTPLPAQPAEYCGCIYQSTSRQAIKVRIAEITKKVNEQRYMLTAGDYADDTYTLPPPVSGQSYTPPASSAPPTPSGGTSDAYLSVAYTEDDSEPTAGFGIPTSTFTVNGIAILAPGSGYTSSSTFKLGSSDPSDPTTSLTVTLDSNGSVTDVAGWGLTVWNAVPYVLITR
jgi:hypothetical protein